MRPSLLDRLVPEARDYTTGEFALAGALAEIEQVARVGARSATVLCAARILEAIASAAITRLAVAPRTSVYANLETLASLELLPRASAWWASALRRVGNDARHVRRNLTAADANVALAFLERCLAWFFVAYRCGPRLDALTVDRAPFGLASASALVTLLHDMEREGPDLCELAERCIGISLAHTPLPAALLAEMLIERGALQSAGALLEATVARFPAELRVRQMLGLWHSRAGRLDEAAAVLTPLLDAVPDAETHGILGGVHKRRWVHDPTDVTSLRSAGTIYREGWRLTRETSPYLGINAAATTLWLGDTTGARPIAERTRALLDERAAAALRAGNSGLGYWDAVTRAEAFLLAGDLDDAVKQYASAFARHSERVGDIAVTEAQADRTLSLVRPGATLRALVLQQVGLPPVAHPEGME